MLRIFKTTVSAVMCLVLITATFAVGFTASADEVSDTQAEINKLETQSKELEAEIKKLKGEKAEQQVVLNAIEKKISNTQAKIRVCNNQISSINAKIEANKAEIEKKNSEIEDVKLEFKKRIRAIYMSQSDSSVKILLGAENFADYLQLAQMTATVSKHDKAIMTKITDAIKELEKKNAENDKLIEEQVSARAQVQSALKELESEESEAQAIYNDINASQKDVEADNAAIEKEIKAKQEYLDSLLNPTTTDTSFINSVSGFMWPVPGHFNITSHFGPRWGRQHQGMDISTGSIYGKPIVAITDGKVYTMYTACSHRTKASRCNCGSGWGNHIGLDHGTIGSWDYRAMYAHMDTVAAGMYVGKYVKQGEVIGYVGTTGNSTGYHLHFGLMRRSAGSTGSYTWVNPYGYFF